MERLPIAKLNPELSALESKQIKAVVTLIWPYSSSARQFALLLAEPEFRLRRKKGQIRARFSGSGAKAIATTGIGIGDEVVLSLQGAHFVQEGVFSTPGKSLDWELSYNQTVVAQIIRDGTEIASLELINVAPTPVPQSPVRRQPVAPSPLQQWASPAFLKRARLSDGPFFEQPAYDPLVDENNQGHDKKRRRKSYRDWKAWTYTGRTPSLGAEDVDMDGDLEAIELSPTRPSKLPKSLASPLPPVTSLPVGHTPGRSENAQEYEAGHGENVEGDSVADEHVEGDTAADTNIEGDTVANTEEFNSPRRELFRNPDHHQLYDGSNDLSTAHGQHEFSGDTEFDTEDEDAAQSETDSASSTEASEEDEEDEEIESDHMHEESEVVNIESVSDVSEHSASESPSATEGVSLGEVDESEEIANAPAIIEIDSQSQHVPQPVEHSVAVDDTPLIDMPPPMLPTLRDLSVPAMLGTLTPIGKEPTSPVLKPLDTPSLPMPSPFPSEHDSTSISYFDDASIDSQLAPFDGMETRDYELSEEADYILENSFFSSVSSSKAGTSRPSHESVFTPVRFTFGMDGAGFSRPLDLSSPPPEDRPRTVEEESKEQLHDQDATESNVDEGSSQRLDDQDASGLHVDGDSNEQLDDQDNTGSNVGEAAISHVGLPPSSTMDTAEAESMAESDSYVIANSTPGHASRNKGSRDGEVEEVLTGKSTALSLNPNATEDQDTQAQKQESPSMNDPKPAPVSKVIDHVSSFEKGNDEKLTASVSGDDSREDRETENMQHEPQAPITDDGIRTKSPVTGSKTPQFDSHSEFIAADLAHDYDVPKAVLQQTTTHLSSQQNNDVGPGSAMEPEETTMDTADTFTTTNDSDVWMPNIDFEDSLHVFRDFPTDQHSEVKMESIEDISMFPTNQEDLQEIEHHHSPESPGEILIKIPDDHHSKIGESRIVSVPDTGPARNTRSATKSSMSASKEPVSVSRRTTRSMRSKASASVDAHASLSPSLRRAGSIVSIQDDMPTSPSYLRSQSRLPSSPADTLKARPVATRQTPNKQSALRDVGSFSDISTSQSDYGNILTAGYEPSQELGLSQGRYSNVAFVEDSEESMRSEDSLSTVQYSDGVQPFMDDMDDPPYHISQYLESSQLQVPPVSGPARQPRSQSLKQASLNPGRIRSISRELYSISPDPQTVERGVSEVATPTTPRAGENAQLRSSPSPPSSIAKQTRVVGTEGQYSSVMNSTRLITSNATQHTRIDTQPSFASNQAHQSFLTPELTQTISAGLRSFQEETTAAENASQQSHKLLPITKSTPRRNSTATDVDSSPPTVHSPDASASSDEETLVTAPLLPSIGLSTPLAYYTPLKDLVYFLNRSSQFHSSSNPDILALVTADSSPAVQAAKGARDWHTTLHVTDASQYPARTTVQVFRAYQNALPVAQKGDVVLLRAFGVKSVNRAPMLASADESSWCVWRFGKPVWGAKKGAWGEMRAREEVKGPAVERGEGEWMEVDRLRKWCVGVVEELEGGDKAEGSDKVKDGE